MSFPVSAKISLIFVITSLMVGSCGEPNDHTERAPKSTTIQPVNHAELPIPQETIAIQHVTLIDGRGGKALPGYTIIITDGLITEIGPSSKVTVLNQAHVVEGSGKYLLPGLIDAHFHLDLLRGLPHMFLKNGITSLRDPGAWIEAYGNERRRGETLPRLFLTGPHLDMFPPAHPRDALIVRDEDEVRQQIRNLAAKGASAIKIYYRMSLGMIRAAADESRKLGLPSTAHLEISDAREVIQTGVTGIEHVTSFGLALVSPFQAEAYKQKVLADNNARREGRYEMWNQMDFDADQENVGHIFELMVENDVFLCPTLAVFEPESDSEDSVRHGGFAKMMEFTRLAHSQGVTLAVGSHSYVPNSEYGWAYHRELELLQACGMTPFEIIYAATYQNARFLKIEDQVGSIEVGKKADLLLLNADPYEDISNMKAINRVMLNGAWLE
ncbi:MAG TPA: amidohydrolase family protein [Lunatimonas sp.]|nr:amidohydrolase family protein [Lunatimonas sp.]